MLKMPQIQRENILNRPIVRSHGNATVSPSPEDLDINYLGHFGELYNDKW